MPVTRLSAVSRSIPSLLFRVVLASATVAAAACSSSPTAPSVSGSSALALAASDQLQAKTPAAPAPFSGTWTQAPVVVVPQANGGTGHVWTRLQLTQKGSTMTGEARRYISTWDASGNPVLVALDLGSPGKVTGTVTGSSMAIVIRDYTETKITLSLTLAPSADGATLAATAGTPNVLSLSTFTR